VLALAVLSSSAIGGCGREDASGDAGPRGPPGSRLTFDAAMLADPPDARPPTTVDAATTTRDSGTTTRMCGGFATSCASLGTASCSSQRGCRLDGICQGSAQACYLQYNSFLCNDQDGCYWSTLTDSCAGSARSCSGYTYDLSCIDQEGCRWEDRCEGSATPCSLLGASECALQRGCSLR
jgi:hypothetical protein